MALKAKHKPIRVRALRKGYYNHKRRYEGNEFNLIPQYVHRDHGKYKAGDTIPPEDQMGSWMKKVDGKSKAKGRKAQGRQSEAQWVEPPAEHEVSEESDASEESESQSSVADQDVI